MFKIIVFKDGDRPTVKEVEAPWKFTKELLYESHPHDSDFGSEPTIQVVYLDDGVEIYCDEEALAKDLPFNRAVPATARPLPPGFTMDDLIGVEPDMAMPGEAGYHNIYGSFILTRYDYDADAPLSLTDTDIGKWLQTLWHQKPVETDALLP